MFIMLQKCLVERDIRVGGWCPVETSPTKQPPLI